MNSAHPPIRLCHEMRERVGGRGSGMSEAVGVYHASSLTVLTWHARVSSSSTNAVKPERQVQWCDVEVQALRLAVIHACHMHHDGVRLPHAQTHRRSGCSTGTCTTARSARSGRSSRSSQAVLLVASAAGEAVVITDADAAEAWVRCATGSSGETASGLVRCAATFTFSSSCAARRTALHASTTAMPLLAGAAAGEAVAAGAAEAAAAAAVVTTAAVSAAALDTTDAWNLVSCAGAVQHVR
jgi:hypothetical protein